MRVSHVRVLEVLGAEVLVEDMRLSSRDLHDCCSIALCNNDLSNHVNVLSVN